MPNNRWTKFRIDLMEQIDFAELYTSLGLEITSERPDQKGWLQAKSHKNFGGPDNRPSAAINIRTGWYQDFRADKQMSIFDFMVEIGEASRFTDAQKKLSDKYGVKPPNLSKNHPEYGVKWQDWKDELAVRYEKNSPITVAALKATGAQMCTYYDEPSFAWTVYDEKLMPVGYYFMPRHGGEFRNSRGEASGKSKCKKFPETEGGLIGKAAVHSLLKDHHPDKQKKINESEPSKVMRALYWCEGAKDMLAGASLFDPTKFVCNGHGASENVTVTQALLIQKSPVHVIIVADNDFSGIRGATKKAQQLNEILNGLDNKCKYQMVTAWSPYDPKEAVAKGGRDLRDWLAKHNETQDLDFKPNPNEHCAPIQLGGIPFYPCADPETEKEITENTEAASIKVRQRQRRIVHDTMAELNLQIYMIYPDGSFVIGSRENDRYKTVRGSRGIDYDDMVGVGGYRFVQHVGRTEIKPGQTMDWKEFCTQMFLYVSEIKSTGEVLGEGIWVLDSPKNGNVKKIAAIRKGDFYFVNNGMLVQQSGPDYGRYIADYESQTDWFDQDLLQEYMVSAHAEIWRTDVHEKLRYYLGTWLWGNEQMHLVATGLVYATWLQTIFKWRPVITLVGESNSGKSWLLEMLSELYLGATSALGETTTAGMLQTQVKNRAMPILLDEFDATGEQKKMFKTLRKSSRGQKIIKGTATQTGKEYFLRHIPWLSGIFYVTDDQADVNRMIQLNLKAPPKGQGTIDRPTQQQAWELGHKILACVLAVAQDAMKKSEDLMKMGKPSRYRESYAVPFGCMAAMLGIKTEEVNKVLEGYLDEFVAEDIKQLDTTTDQESALMDIMSSTIRLRHDAPVSEATVSQMLTDGELAMFWDELQSRGLVVKKHKEGFLYLAICPKMMISETGLLSKSKWKGNAGLSQVLSRLPDVLLGSRSTVRIGGTSRYCFCMKLDVLKLWLRSRENFDKRN